MAPFRAILLPGIVLPGKLAYGTLVSALGSATHVVVKDLEVYATPEPPPHYTLGLEVEGVQRAATERGWERFHLVGYSGGGAAALAFAAQHAERLASLALLEPAWAGRWDLSPAEQALWRELDRLEALPPEQFMRKFMQLSVRSGVELPPPSSGDPPPWMKKRPSGIRALMTTFKTYELDFDALARFSRPVYFALGRLSNPDQYGAIATRLSRLFPDFELEVFEGRHHFDPPHRIEPERVATSLTALWRRADQEGGVQ
jgi:pimeloyl-ACP methyl ester carboxylesterase